MENPPLEKKDRLLSALDRGMVMVHLDARAPGVLVPAHLRAEHHLRLNLSYRFDPPDLSVGDWGVRSTLSFAGSRFTVAIPWSALFGITSYVTNEFWVYPDSLPPELLQDATEKVPAEEVPGAVPAAPARPQLREVTGEPEAQPDGRPEAEDKPRSPPSRGHLRVIK
ncbi:MAG: stringent starvation protein B [Deltaproteobacteria bacterium]|nr:stringent starvation protein B [Deltaproteobacteria bacterium]